MTSEEIRAFREKHHMTQRQLNELINKSLDRKGRNSVGRWERGERAIPADVETFLTNLEFEGEQFTVTDPDGREVPFEPLGDTPPPPPPGVGAEQVAGQLAGLVGASGYARVCEELWELVATGVGMVGAVTGSDALRKDGEIIAHDKAALGKAYGKLAEQNATFRNMLAGMTGGGAWLEVALVSGITAGKLMRNHQSQPAAVAPDAAPAEQPPDNGRMYGDGAVIDLPV